MLDTQEYDEIFGSLFKSIACWSVWLSNDFDYYEASYGINSINSQNWLQNYSWEKHIGIGFWLQSQKNNEIDTFLHT